MDLGQVFTKRDIADYMTSLFTLEKEADILEPCFGSGAFLASLRKGGFKNVSGYEIDEDLFRATDRQFPDYHLYRGDFLSADNGMKYDGVIMNPPYIRHEKIDGLERYGISKKILKKSGLYRGLPSTANLYMYFVIKSIEVLRDGGELIVIFPGSWLKTQNGEKFKAELEKRCGIEEEIYVSGSIFEENAMVEVLILKLIKNRPDVLKGRKKLVADGRGVHEMPLYEASAKNLCGMELGFRASFHEMAKVRRGLSTGWNGFFINPAVENPSNKAPILSSPKAVCGYRTEGAAWDNLFLADGKEDLPEEWLAYIAAAQGELMKKKSPKTLYEKCRNGMPWYALNPIDSRGILFSYFVRNDMKFILNDAKVLARDNFYIIQPHEKGGELLLFALLNNIYTYMQLEHMGKEYGAGLLKLQRYDIENLMFPPLADISGEDKIYLVQLAEKLARCAAPQCITEITKVLEKYSSVKARDVMGEYENRKAVRLGDGHGKKCS